MIGPTDQQARSGLAETKDYSFEGHRVIKPTVRLILLLINVHVYAPLKRENPNVSTLKTNFNGITFVFNVIHQRWVKSINLIGQCY